MLTDTHCHLDLGKFDEDRAAMLERAAGAGVGRMLIPGTDLASSRRAIRLAGSTPAVYAAIGVHPSEALTWDPQTIPALRELAVDLKAVAVGEIGLDYYWDTAPHDRQRLVLCEQLDLARELELPVIIHLRERGDAAHGDCADDLLAALGDWTAGLRDHGSALVGRPGVLHSFAGSPQTAERALAMGFMIGVTGPVTYKNASARRELVALLPMDRVLIETDSPFLAPVPMRGKRNEPAYIRYIADKIAQIKSRDPEEIAAVTSSNAARLFSWGGAV